jgi:toxin ParE1/3/4
VRVEWLAEAERSLTAQLAWIADRDPWLAIDVGDRIEVAVGRLGSYPQLGRPGRIAGTRELVVTGTPDIVVSRVEAAAVILVLRVLHGAQRWPPAQ